MPHIAVVVSGLSGRMHSGFELISRLEGEGHRVTCLCQPYTTETVAKQGFDYLEIPEINFKFAETGENTGLEGTTGKRQRSWLQKLMQHLKHRDNRYKQDKRILKLAEYEKIWTELSPDQVLIDVELHDLIFTAYASKIPITLFHTWFSDVPSAGLPPIRTGITPGKRFEGSTLGIAYARFVDWAKIRARFFINTVKFQEYRRATLKKYAKEIGFPVRDLALSTLPPLYRFKGLPILLLAMKELDFPHQPAKNLRYVGPMVYENRSDLDAESQDAKRLDKILESKKTDGKRLVYCGVGSMAEGDVRFLKKVIDIVGREPEWVLVLSLGRNLSLERFPKVPQNVHLFSWVPQLQVLSQADCCINHAGINSINECLHFAVPMVIYSLKYTDENGNAARMAYHGLAVVGDKDKDDSAVIRKNINSVLTDHKYRKTIYLFNEMYREYRQRPLTPLVLEGNKV